MKRAENQLLTVNLLTPGFPLLFYPPMPDRHPPSADTHTAMADARTAAPNRTFYKEHRLPHNEKSTLFLG